MYSRKKKSLSRLLKQQVKKVDKFGFFQNSPWFWSKTGNVFIFILQAKQARKNVLGDILQRKKKPFHTKNSKLKKWKIQDFSKGVNKNWQFFNLKILSQAKQAKKMCVENILGRKKAFPHYKNNK